MTDRPILFSAPMVRALLDGRKTQTRRILKPQPELLPGGTWHVFNANSGTIGVETADLPTIAQDYVRYEKGDRLWVRETWSGAHEYRETPPSQRESYATPDGPVLREDIWFWADGNPTGGDYEKPRPGIHMPRWASRLTLLVTDVRVERLQDCYVEDACAEGALLPPFTDQFANVHALSMYQAIWDGINGEGSWETNSWVVAITFEVIKQNIDEVQP